MTFFHFGYIDPGAGSIMLQALVGGVLGAAYIGRKYLSQVITSIKAVFSNADATRPAAAKKLDAQDKL